MKNSPVQILKIFGKLIVGQMEVIVYLSLKCSDTFCVVLKMAVQIFGPNIWCDVGVDSFLFYSSKRKYTAILLGLVA